MNKRIVGIYAVLLAGFTLLMVRISVLIQGDDLVSAARSQSTYLLPVGETRGTIYDRNCEPMVNREQETLLAVVPTPETMLTLKELLPQKEFEESVDRLKARTPTLFRSTTAPQETEGVFSFSLPVRYTPDQHAPHILGYLNSSGEGVYGIEKGYNDLLQSFGGELKMRYTVDARGNTLSLSPSEVIDTRTTENGGIVLTIDQEIQKIAESCGAPIERGAVVVMDVETGQLLAMASFPDFDLTDVAASLDDPNGPLFNRALAAYNVGSTFKVCVTAAAMESGISSALTYTCNGYYEMGEQRYYCHNRNGHGTLDLLGGLEHSCNPYFINLGQRVGSARLLEMAYAMGFGSAAKLAEGMVSAKGNLPAPSQVSVGELANLSFGQGQLMATPVQIAQMFAEVANGGRFVAPTLYLGTTLDGNMIQTSAQTMPQKQIFSERTARILREYLNGVVEEGSGTRAQPIYYHAAGKTASAQTGVYQDDTEIVHAWFGGFYPYENPRYAIVVFQEGGAEGGGTPAEVFRNICDGITLYREPWLAEETYLLDEPPELDYVLRLLEIEKEAEAAEQRAQEETLQQESSS